MLMLAFSKQEAYCWIVKLLLPPRQSRGVSRSY